MTGHDYTVAVLKADGTAFVVTHWETAEAALDQFKASLALAGHPPYAVQRHVEAWKHQPKHDSTSFDVLNPDLQGAVRITANPPKGRRMSTQ